MMIFLYDQRTLIPSKSDFAMPYHTNTGVPDWVFYVFLAFCLYVAVRVWIELRRDRKAASGNRGRHRNQ